MNGILCKLELILEAADETHGLGERRWDAAKSAREMEFLLDKTGGPDRAGGSKPTAAASTVATARRQRLKNGSIFFSRRNQMGAKRPQATPNASAGRADHSDAGGQRQQSRKQQRERDREGQRGTQREQTAANKSKHERKRRDPNLARVAAVRKLKERQRLTTKAGRQPHNEKRRQQARPTAGQSGGRSGRSTAGTSINTSAAKLPLNPHDVLGVSPGATRREIQRAFRALSLRYHPDRNDEPGAAARFAELGAAAEQLLQAGQSTAPKKRQQQ